MFRRLSLCLALAPVLMLAHAACAQTPTENQQFTVANPDIATTLVGTANPQNILDNIRYAETPIDPEHLAAVTEILKPIQNFNFTRGRPENHDAIVG